MSSFITETKQEAKRSTDVTTVFKTEGSIETASITETSNYYFDNTHRKDPNWKAFVNIVCVVAGTGVLQLPYALAESGWVGILLILVSGFIGVYSGTILIRCLYYDKDRRLGSYPEIGGAAFGRYGRYFTLFFHYLYILGTTCIYIILAGNYLNELLEHADIHIGDKACKAIVAVIMWAPFVAMKTMSEVAILALFGFLATVIVVGVAVVVGFINMASIHATENITYSILNITSLPSAIASISFAFAGTVVYPHVEGTMKNPKDWPKVLTIGMVTITFMYLLMSISGYAIYGDTVQSPVLDSLPYGPPKIVAVVLISVHVVLAAPIMLTTFAVEAEESLSITVERFGKLKEFGVRFAFRTLTTAALYGISISIPYFADVLLLVGALSTCMVFFVFPIVWYVRFFGIRALKWWERIFAVVILILGAVGVVMGSVQAIQALIHDVQAGNTNPAARH
ncbi:hypothetical protein H4R34_001752 [Dimargaris verticillata]|uniref:Amino acid transporter transmembrane domain-containing protein n=1 Tax=Dimargaris verticillata TaxID=2761393 RepID=A0A9W8B316_9FUNG|nr:hypothetical protein H4R34_001752 [Dimargaris verticillata]